MKVSYGRYLVSPAGSVYTQRIAVSEKEYEAISDSIRREIELGYPNKEQYGFYSVYDCEHRFTELRLEKVKENPLDSKAVYICFLKIPHVKYLTMFNTLKDRLKINQNTYIQIVK